MPIKRTKGGGDVEHADHTAEGVDSSGDNTRLIAATLMLQQRPCQNPPERRVSALLPQPLTQGGPCGEGQETEEAQGPMRRHHHAVLQFTYAPAASHRHPVGR